MVRPAFAPRETIRFPANRRESLVTDYYDHDEDGSEDEGTEEGVSPAERRLYRITSSLTKEEWDAMAKDKRSFEIMQHFVERTKKLEEKLAKIVSVHNLVLAERSRAIEEAKKHEEQVGHARAHGEAELQQLTETLTADYEAQLTAVLERQDVLEAEKAALQDRLNTIAAAGPVAAPAHRQLELKLPDPKMFKGPGDDQDIDQWVRAMKRKLEFNASGHPEKSKINYVASRLEGIAEQQVNTRMEEDSVNPYHTVDDILAHLTQLYGNPDKVRQAKQEFRGLYMKATGEKFTEFFGRFLHVYTTAGLSMADIVDELNDKLSVSLQNSVKNKYLDGPELNEFVEYCTKMDNTDRLIATRTRREERFNKANKPAATTTTLPVRTSVTPVTPKPAATASPGVASPSANRAKQMLLETRKCYECNQTGHLAWQCPTKVAAIVTETPVVEKPPAENADA